MDRNLALELADTLVHDGNGGVADELADPAARDAWLAAHLPGARVAVADLRALRGPVRALLARAVTGPPSSADAAGSLPTVDAAVAAVNAAAARVPVVPVLTWGEEPVVALSTPDGDGLAAVARSLLAFLAGPDRARLRACPAPRCVRYFLKGHNRQNFCKAACGNRARVARHYEKQRAATG
ncbi:hypothetical protein Afil01_50950 [Actinorhabdospora filicis]|uniref:Zinc finger CGNR domain-containing protein n=1 Tax=Actinorhabdospora filicis TaxID=1785913 RepID=A0A9W6WBP6_9ACTN|nr:ABATE domain-containing protein [Actinorhabdospora filicis]GLZ80288.1 hypothetical protein Afil01_50950 [Actinorhabdospora filicis]